MIAYKEEEEETHIQKTIQLMDSELDGADSELTGELVTIHSPRWNIGVMPTPSQGPLPLYVIPSHPH